jgi:hypothetical protein
VATEDKNSLPRSISRLRSAVGYTMASSRWTLLCLSLACFIGVVVLWCRSYFVCDIINASWLGVSTGSSSLDGRFMISWTTKLSAPNRKPQWTSRQAKDFRWVLDPQRHAQNVTDGNFGRFRVLGLDCATGPYHAYEGPSIPGAWYTHVVVPHWVAALVFLTIPAIWAGRRTWRILRCKLTERGCCVRCGYDLRASRERCPECGTPIDSSTQADAKPRMS